MSKVEVGDVVVARAKQCKSAGLPIDRVTGWAVARVGVVIDKFEVETGRRRGWRVLVRNLITGRENDIALSRVSATRFRAHGADYRVIKQGSNENISYILAALSPPSPPPNLSPWPPPGGHRVCSECGRPLAMEAV